MNPILRPAIPLIDMQISSTDGGDVHLDQHIASAKTWNLDFSDLRAWCGFRLHNGKHGFGHEINSRCASKSPILAFGCVFAATGGTEQWHCTSNITWLACQFSPNHLRPDSQP